eukprot:849860-Rhodomonas_salina.1
MKEANKKRRTIDKELDRTKVGKYAESDDGEDSEEGKEGGDGKFMKGWKIPAYHLWLAYDNVLSTWDAKGAKEAFYLEHKEEIDATILAGLEKKKKKKKR